MASNFSELLIYINELEADRRRLRFLVKQGPPRDNFEGIGLNEEAWEVAYGHVPDERKDADMVAMRSAIDACEAAQPALAAPAP